MDVDDKTRQLAMEMAAKDPERMKYVNAAGESAVQASSLGDVDFVDDDVLENDKTNETIEETLLPNLQKLGAGGKYIDTVRAADNINSFQWLTPGQYDENDSTTYKAVYRAFNDMHMDSSHFVENQSQMVVVSSNLRNASRNPNILQTLVDNARSQRAQYGTNIGTRFAGEQYEDTATPEYFQEHLSQLQPDDIDGDILVHNYMTNINDVVLASAAIHTASDIVAFSPKPNYMFTWLDAELKKLLGDDIGQK